MSWGVSILSLAFARERHCFMHPKATINQYRGESEDRKPGPGLLLRAMAEYREFVSEELHPEQCLMVGDRPEDEQAAAAAGIAFQHADTFFALEEGE